MGTPIYKKLNFSVRTCNVLKFNGIETTEQFMALSPDDVLALSNAGSKVATEVYHMQEELRDEKEAKGEQAIIDATVKLNQLIYNETSSLRLVVNDDGFVEVLRRLA